MDVSKCICNDLEGAVVQTPVSLTRGLTLNLNKIVPVLVLFIS